MDTMTWEQLFGPVTGKLNPRHKLGTEFSEWRVLDNDTWFNGYEYATGSKFRVFESENFGHVVFDQNSKTPNGEIPGKFSHRF